MIKRPIATAIVAWKNQSAMYDWRRLGERRGQGDIGFSLVSCEMRRRLRIVAPGFTIRGAMMCARSVLVIWRAPASAK
jgi:hypothetical protein